MNEELVKQLRDRAKRENDYYEHGGDIINEAADTIEELSKRIDRAVELYRRGVERSAMYEALVGIASEPPKEET